MTDIVQAIYQRIQKMTPSRLEDAYLMDMAGLEIKGLRKLLDRIVVRNPDGTVAIRLTEDALNAAAEYLPQNAKAVGLDAAGGQSHTSDGLCVADTEE